MTAAKRLDLQGIRGFAILVVLGFHFYPDYFPNGYLGVDQFFVLSGFLMCMLLKRAENQTPSTLILLFYSKRFKRILPLYLLLIFISMISLYYFFPDSAIETNQQSAIHALLFVSNRPATEDADYFQMLSTAIDIFTHTWSLSVEIQFYFLVPFLFLLGSRIPDQKFQYGYYGFTGLISFIFFFLSPDTVAFNSVFARIWQFLVGMIVYLVGNRKQMAEYQLLLDSDLDEGKHDVQKSKKSNVISYVSLMMLISITTFPLVLPADIVRPLATFGTGFLMLISEDNVVLSNRVLTYIGDISYSLYLIHWPIYAYWKLTCHDDQILLAVALVSSVILATICFETYEKWYLKLSSTNTAFFCVMLILLNIAVIQKDELSNSLYSTQSNSDGLDDVTPDMSFDDAIRMNKRWTKNERKNFFSPTCVTNYGSKSPFGLCRQSGLNSTAGKYKLALIGNSIAANHGTMFYQECGHKAKSMFQLTYPGCEPLHLTDVPKWKCPRHSEEFITAIEKEQPDYAFIATRYFTVGSPLPSGVSSLDKDPVYQQMKERMLKFIANIKYKLFILDGHPGIHGRVVDDIATLLKNGTDPVEIDNSLVFEDNYLLVRRRYAQLVKDCKGKCELIDYVPKFFNDSTKTFRYFDKRGFSYFTAKQHFTPHGIEFVRPIWTDICRKL